MSRLVPIQFGTQVAKHDSGPLSVEYAENIYLEKAPEGAKSPYILLGVAGLKLFASAGSGPIRGAHFMNGFVYVVSGDRLYSVDVNGSEEHLGYIPGVLPVRMAHNDGVAPGPHIWIATGDELYAVNRNEVLTVANGEGVTDVTYQDGYLIGAVGGTQKFVISDLDDATTINALNFTSADAFPGRIVGVEMDHREVYILKDDSIECYFNSGATFPFERSQVIELGTFAGASASGILGSIFLLGADLQVYRVAGYQTQIISTSVIANLISSQKSPETAIGFCYQQAGHTFYELTFSDLTITYDTTTGLWHTRKSVNMDCRRTRGFAFARPWQKNIVGDKINGNLYELDRKTYDENGAALIRRAAGSPIWNNGRRFVVDEFFLDIEPGLGLVAGQGSDPQVILDWSSDGGKTYSNEIWRSFGKIGEYYTRPTWHNLGAHYNWTPRITVSDPVPVRISGAYARITRLAS